MLRGSVPYGGFSSHNFSRAPQAAIQRSKFDRSFGVKTAFDAGYLVPIMVDEILPGDTMHLRMEGFARMSTPIFPVMDNMYLETFYFFIPNRLVWDNWERFNGYQRNPGDSTDFIVPQIVMPAVTGATEGSLADHFGIPTAVPNLSVNSLPFRCYNLLYNDWFRDENLQDSVVVDVDDGPDNYSDYVLLRRNKRRDYFTSCLPFPQKGPDVVLPLGTSAPVISSGTGVPTFNTTGQSNRALFSVNGSSAVVFNANSTATDDLSWNTTSLAADLTDAAGASINDLRLAVQTQKMFERDARGGTRYIEVVHSHFGVISPDFRMQRPEYIGGGSTPIFINPVAQTSATSGSNALGDLAGYGVASPTGHGFVYSSTEHGFIIGLVMVRADLNYQSGLERFWSRQTRFDYYWPALAHLGEQAVLNKEIYAQGTSADDEVFGYQERYAEYRYKPNLITGLFRSNATGSLDSWHLAQDFGSLPALNDEFIVEDPPMERILAVNTEPDFLFEAFFLYNCARPMPVYSVPGNMDRF